jgi:hypothetical protein
MELLTALPGRNQTAGYQLNYFRVIFTLSALAYLLLSYYLIPADSNFKEALVEGKYMAIIPSILLLLTFVSNEFNKNLQAIVAVFFLIATIHLLSLIAVNQFAGNYEVALIGLILLSNLHLSKIIFIVVYNVISLVALEYVFILTGSLPEIHPITFFLFLIGSLAIVIPFQIYRINFAIRKNANEVMNDC